MANHSFSIDQRADRAHGFNSAGAQGLVQLVDSIGHAWAHIFPIGSWGGRVEFDDDCGSFAQEWLPTRAAALTWLCTTLAGSD